jgi:flagellar protein FlaF
MAVGEIIGAAIGALVLIYIAYVLVGGMLTTVETVTLAQTEVTHMNEDRLNTALGLTSHAVDGETVTITLNNTGSVVIGNFTHMDLYLGDGSTQPTLFRHSSAGTSPNWTDQGIFSGGLAELVHPGELDPGEELVMQASYAGDLHWIKVVAGNGATVEAAV